MKSEVAWELEEIQKVAAHFGQSLSSVFAPGLVEESVSALLLVNDARIPCLFLPGRVVRRVATFERSLAHERQARPRPHRACRLAVHGPRSSACYKSPVDRDRQLAADIEGMLSKLERPAPYVPATIHRMGPVVRSTTNLGEPFREDGKSR